MEKSIKVNADGTTTLGVYSTKNNIKKEIVVTVGKVDAQEVKILINNKEVNGTIEAKVNEKIDNITFKVNPKEASQEVEVYISNGEGVLTKNENGSYSFMSAKEGQSTLLVKAKGTNIFSSIIFNVTKEAEATTLIEKMMKNTYTCKERVLSGGDDILSNKLTFKSSSKALFEVKTASSITYKISCNISIDETKSIVVFTSFDISPKEELNIYGEYYPIIELNKEFKVLDNGAKIQIVLYNIWDNEKVNIKDYSTNLAAYDFVTE